MQRLCLFLIIIFAIVSFFKALQPELGFDALWYHLTIPKLYRLWGEIKFIPGGLLYYSAMPKLGELLYWLFNADDTAAHLLNWGFGLGTVWIIYRLSKDWLAGLIFYVTPIVGWLSGSAYIDLIRTFFEVLAFYFIVRRKIFFSAAALSLAVGTKTLALGSLPVLALVIYSQDRNFKSVLVFSFYVLVFSAPWFVVSYLWTGHLFYPLGAGILDARHQLVFPQIWDLWRLFTTSPDPISPVFLAVLPFIITKPYVFLSALVWLFTPRTDWGRFILPYLPVWAVYAAPVIKTRKILMVMVIFIALINLGYRLAAQREMLPYLLGRESRTAYLCRHLDFSTGVFADCDGWFARNLKPTDYVLVENVHNLYYINFPFVHESWYAGEPVTHILTYNKVLNKPLLYENNLTGLRLYAN
jgi:hypothetical protein